MDDFGMLARDFGFRPQGKSAPMKSNNIGSDAGDHRARSPSTTSSPFVDDQSRDGLFNNIFGAPPKASSNSKTSSSSSTDFDYDSIFKSNATNDTKNNKSSNSSSLPVYDKPVYDEDIFDGLPGLKSKSVSASSQYDGDVFAPMTSPQKRIDQFDDLLGNLGRTEKVEPKKSTKSSGDFDDLIPGFGSGSYSGNSRPIPESNRPQKSASNLKSNVVDDPFVIFESTSTRGASSPGMFVDPLEDLTKFHESRSSNLDNSSVHGVVFDDLDPLGGFSRSSVSSETNKRGKDGSPSRVGSSMSGRQTSASTEQTAKSSFNSADSQSQKKVPVENTQDLDQTSFDIPTISTDSHKPSTQTAPPPSYASVNFNQINSQPGMSSNSEQYVQPSDDVWLIVSEIPLFTQPTSAPPPSRPPPPIPRFGAKPETGSFSSNTTKRGDEFSSPPRYTRYSQSARPSRPSVKSPVSQIDELEDFSMGRTQNSVDDNADLHSVEELNSHSAAAASAMKEAMDRAEVKFRHAKEVREREYAKVARSKEAMSQERDLEDQEREFTENQERLDSERRQREDEEREQRKLEKERERAREIEREKEKARQAVERATREARERAAVEARERAAAEARLKTERAAVQRAQAEARERAAVEARERAEKAAAEARERANAEAREKEVREKAAATKAEAEARRRAERAAVERVAAEARERAAAAARAKQQRNENDLESFFGMGSRPSSAPRPRASSSETVDPFSSGGRPEGQRRTSASGTASNMTRASSTTSIVDDLTSIFGGAASSGDFQEVEGETEERRRARLERHQRTQERAAKALAEKNERDLQTQRDQEERHRIAETLDIEIKRWSAGKEGNLRALLSTLQYVLWPECGWQPVSLTDLITGASVKKVYRKATLCIHPDKVQQKGANLQQKYIAEKVFDLLKEAWNKFNSEELF